MFRAGIVIILSSLSQTPIHGVSSVSKIILLTLIWHSIPIWFDLILLMIQVRHVLCMGVNQHWKLRSNICATGYSALSQPSISFYAYDVKWTILPPFPVRCFDLGQVNDKLGFSRCEHLRAFGRPQSHSGAVIHQQYDLTWQTRQASIIKFRVIRQIGSLGSMPGEESGTSLESERCCLNKNLLEFWGSEVLAIQ